MGAFQGRTVVLGVGGGIAAYKACELARLVVKGGGQVRVAMTRAATRFVGPLTFQAISGAPVLVDLLDPEQDGPTATFSTLAPPTCWWWPPPPPTCWPGSGPGWGTTR